MIQIGGWQFDGPHYERSALRDVQGVYAVLDHREASFFVLDVGEAGCVRSRLLCHDRQECWGANGQGRLCFAALYTPDATADQRRAVESRIREQFSPTCGVR